MLATATRIVFGGLIGLGLLASAGGLAGCAGSPAPDPSALEPSRPADFALGLTVFGPVSDTARPGQRPARYLLEPDGWLRAAIGPGANQTVHPTLARWLDAPTRDALWAMARGASLGGDGVTPIESPERFDPPAGRRVYLIELTAGGHRYSAAVSEGDPGAGPIAAIADRLAGLAWVSPGP
jgi:hypothetical protein